MKKSNAVTWHPGHELLLPKIVRAENCHLYDAEGRRYVDLESGVWCTSIGHGHPRVRQTIVDQMSRVAHTGFVYSSETTEEAGADILSLLGFENGTCVFLCSGSEAVEYAVRTMQTLADRPKLMTMTDSYFGVYGAASQKKEGEWFLYDWLRCEAQHCEERCEHFDGIPFDEISGFLFEPGSSSGLVRFPPKRLIQNIVSEVRKRDGLLVVNEVTTGIGRTGAWFGYQHYDIAPDIVALGKGIGNGYPVSVSALSRRALQRLGGEPVKHIQSHQNDPLGAAVASTVVKVVREESLIDRSSSLSERLLGGLARIRERHDRVLDVRGRGLMVALDLEDDAQATRTTRIHRELVRRGYIVGQRPGLNVLRLDPSLTIEETDIDGFLATLDTVIEATA